MSAIDASLWDAEVLDRVRHLHLRARHVVDSIVHGSHRSRRVGQAIEFAGYQEYIPGMDLRFLDWKAYARSDRLVVKQFETETRIPCQIVLDLSADLATGSSGRARRPDLTHGKSAYAIVLAATLAHYLILQGEPVGLELVGGEGYAHRSLPVRGGQGHLQQIFSQLAMARPSGRGGLKAALQDAGSRVRRRSWVAVISDGMEEPSEWLPSLSAFVRRGSDVRFFHLYDRREWTLDYEQPAVFFSPEGGPGLQIDPKGAGTAFDEVVRDYVAEVRHGVLDVRGRYLPVPADLPMDEVMRACVLDHPLAVEPP